MTTARRETVGQSEAGAVAKAGMPVHFRDVPAETDSGVAVHRVHADLEGSGLAMSVLVVSGDATGSRQVEDGRDELLYVLAGTGEAVVDGVAHALAADTAVRVAGGQTCSLRSKGDGPLEVVAVSGRTAGDVATGPGPVSIDLAGREKHPAVSNREFQVLFDPGCGCSGMTQFVGYVPALRTPRHIHPYDEMLCIVSGSGTVEINGVEQEVSPGWCYYLPRGTPHLVQNRRAEFLVELGVFTPAGSPAQNTPVE
jgi:mannose-6-phosphate isomerase-like protein (cupin superfamily)